MISICLVRLFGSKIKYSLGIGLTNLVTADVLPTRINVLSDFNIVTADVLPILGILNTCVFAFGTFNLVTISARNLLLSDLTA